MKLSNGRQKPSPFRKSAEERGKRSKSAMSPRLANGSSPRSDSVVWKVKCEIYWSTVTGCGLLAN